MTRRVMGIPIRATELLILDRMKLNVHASQICTKANRGPSALPIRESKVMVEGPTSTNRERQLVTPSMVEFVRMKSEPRIVPGIHHPRNRCQKGFLIAQRQSVNMDAWILSWT